uniref:Uncharacterized protein n=1 Tax=Pristionchus pacificus TaxID=54126 RepID=A0A2A6CWK0_PRIPA|eukprot:PDM82614.1 protein kinase [Pristionchus pacificus]
MAAVYPLHKWMNAIDEEKHFLTRVLSSEEILRQITSGVEYLHSTRRIHRDLKPHNVLFANRAQTLRAVIADFGLCKEISHGKDFTVCSGVVGTDGWMPPEALKGENTSYPWDIFALGCIYYYVLTDGSHPFGDSAVLRSSKILNGEYSLEQLYSPEAKRLIGLMISTSPIDRPSASEILINPFLWNSQKRLDFFNQANNAEIIVKKNWNDEIDEKLRQHCLKKQTYKGESVQQLLRFIRNTNSHYGYHFIPIQREVKSPLFDEPYPEKFVLYFTTRFPLLLLHVYEVMKVCTGEQKLKTFYPDNIKARVQILRIISMILILRGYDCTHYSNYNEMLSIFLRKKCAANLITPNLKLDALPTEGKIRIILELMKAIERLPDEPQWCGEDGHGNRYYLIGDGRLYVEYGAKLCGMLKRASNNMPHQKWKLLAETEKMWNTVSLIMEGFDESEISRKVASMLAVAKEKILSAAQIRTAEQQFYLHMRRIPITTH